MADKTSIRQIRKQRMAEAVETVRRLLDGDEVTYAGQHHVLTGARTKRSLQHHLPILVGVNGRAALAHAAHHADTIGLTMLGRTLAGGNRHEVRSEADRLDATVAHIASTAAGRTPELELNVVVQAVVVTDDRVGAAESIGAEFGLTIEDALTTPFLALGTHGQIADHLRECRRRWGITYFTVRAIDDFAPVIERLRPESSPTAAVHQLSRTGTSGRKFGRYG